MFDNFRHESFIFLLRILLIQDAVLLVLQTAAAEKIFGVEAEVAVEAVAVKPADVAEAVHRIRLAPNRFIHELGIVVIVHVIGIRERAGVRHEFAVMGAGDFKTLECILGMLNRVARAVLIPEAIHVFARESLFLLQEVPSHLVEITAKFRERLLILLFRHLFVADPGLRVLHAETGEAVLTVAEIVSKRAVAAPFGVLQPAAVIAPATVDDFVAEFTINGIRTITEVLRPDRPVAVVAILTFA